MEIIRGIYNLSNRFAQCALTLGNFDGIHLGHQTLISRLKQVGKEKNLPTVVMLFEPQPLEFFCLERSPSRLMSFKEKCQYIKTLGVDYVLAVSFNRTFSAITANTFIEQALIKQLNAQYIVIGDDFQFGAQRQGDANLLKHYAAKYGFCVESMPTLIQADQRVSSTAVRKALFDHDFHLASQLLGRDYTIQGRVIHGNQLARQLGFPTANIHLNRQKPALHGVYFVKVKNCCNDQHYFGIANIGVRPTVNGKTAILEVNIFDFNQDIYNHYLEVQFIEKIRDEVKFDSLTALQAQIAQDICIAQQIKAKSLSF